MDELSEFGKELRRRRIAAGISLSSFARKIFYSKGYLSRVENGKQRPSTDMVRRFDWELQTGGALIRLLRTSGETVPEAGAAQLPGTPSPLHSDYASAAQAVDVQILFNEGFEHARRLGHRYSPRIVLSGLLPQIGALSSIAAETRDPEAATSLRYLVARQQEYAGWMFQEHGDQLAAANWTAASARTAAVVGDTAFGLWTLVRRAEIALYQDDPGAVLGLCARVTTACRDDLVLGAVAARVAAQGHALEGDRSACLLALERAAEISSRSGSSVGTFGTTSLSDPLSMVTGWALYELGDAAAAAETLDREVSKIPATSVRSRARFGIRAALAHATVGDVDQACAMARSLLIPVEQTASATIAGDLRRLCRSLARWSTDPRVSALLPELRAASRLPGSGCPEGTHSGIGVDPWAALP